MKASTLVVTMGCDNYQLHKKMNIQTDCIIGNQTKNFSKKQFKENGLLIEYLNTDTTGVGINRNIVLMNSYSDVSILADDDIVFYDKYEEIVLNAYKQYPDADVLIFSLKTKDDRYTEKKDKRVRFYNCLKYGAARFTFRTDRIKEKGIHFNVSFGGGSKYSNGEDSLFIMECINKGLKVYSIAQIIGELDVDRESTWFNGYTNKFFVDKYRLYNVMTTKKLLSNILFFQDIFRHKKKYRKYNSALKFFFLIKKEFNKEEREKYCENKN